MGADVTVVGVTPLVRKHGKYSQSPVEVLSSNPEVQTGHVDQATQGLAEEVPMKMLRLLQLSHGEALRLFLLLLRKMLLMRLLMAYHFIPASAAIAVSTSFGSPSLNAPTLETSGQGMSSVPSGYLLSSSALTRVLFSSSKENLSLSAKS